MYSIWHTGGLLTSLIALALPCVISAQGAKNTIHSNSRAADPSPHLVVIKRCTRLLASRERLTTEELSKALEQRGQAYLLQGMAHEALHDFTDLEKIKPGDPLAICRKVLALCWLNRREEGVRVLADVLRRDPNCAYAWMVLGKLYLVDRNFDVVFRCANHAITLERNCLEAYYDRAMVYSQTDPLKCLEDINHYIHSSSVYDSLAGPESPYCLRGDALLALNRPAEAAEDYLEVKRLAPASPNHWASRLFRAYRDNGDWRRALAAAQEALHADQTDAVSDWGRETWNVCLAECLAELGQHQRAEQLLVRAINDLPAGASDYDVVRYVGDVYVKLGKYQDAIIQYDASCDLVPNNTAAILGKAHLLACCPASATRDGKTARDLAQLAYNSLAGHRWLQWNAAIVLAEAYAETGDYGRAIEYAREALEIVGPNATCRKDLQEKLSLFQKQAPYRIRHVKRGEKMGHRDLNRAADP